METPGNQVDVHAGDDLQPRALQMLSSCADLIALASSEHLLLNGFSALMTAAGGYRFCWIGQALEDDSLTIRPIAQSGGEHYLEGIETSWSLQSKFGSGPTGEAVRTGQIVECAEMRTDERLLAWRDAIIGNGLRSMICLPLSDTGHTFGVLALYRDTSGQLPDAEVHLLVRLTRLMAVALLGLRSRADHSDTASVMLKTATALSSSHGAEFLWRLVVSVTDALGADAGFIARHLSGDGGRMHLLAGVADGQRVSPFDVVLAGSPCENLLTQRAWMICDRVASRYPADALLTELGAQGYAAARLDDFDGQPLGVLYVLFRQPLLRTTVIRSTLQIFAIRAAGEIERQEADSKLADHVSLLDKAHDAIIVRDTDQRVQFWNAGAQRLYGWSAAEARGKVLPESLLAPSDIERIQSQLRDSGEWIGTLHQRRKDGSVVLVEGHWSMARDSNKQPKSLLAIDTDITERTANEAEIQHLAFYDSLTGLPNRLLLLDRLQQVQGNRLRSQHAGALLFIDLDNFKTLNDTLGHDMGDLLLQQVARRLSSCVRTEDTVGRLGGDEFVVMLVDLDEGPDSAASHAAVVSDKILQLLRQPYQIAGCNYHSTASIGVTLFGPDDTVVTDLLKRADMAMYQAKAAGRDTQRFFAPSMQIAVSARALLESQLRMAVSNQEFELHFQAQVRGDGKLSGVEALIRWKHPTRGLLWPVDFIGLAEESGLILPLGRWVLSAGCVQLARWQAHADTADLQLAINVSARQFRHPQFVADVVAAIAQSGVDPCHLKLEMTESVLFDDIEESSARMTELRKLGIGFSLDDFGTGYSSLSYLKILPINQLKIDQSFVRDIQTSKGDAAIARTIVSLADSFGLEVIAEGVENAGQRACLATLGCHSCQGYLFNRPMPAVEFEALLTQAFPFARVAAAGAD
ncbi:EAL domain-containing protein [Actimicrobium sp. CCC2.4]|uniref:bifunctional diguanylate cyclase/phosphodiesterase n=1 Tax=Actimicrobium sp. CCC2.4 TaxID=3048606 RepID=UPI002AC8C2E9|nr:EAL domain-containing protein [Actimicrobium sp. CCC2.4]MEB0134757.1 EAL domain-containing protein [Actimicrobium sp. CCC2.4]WPX30696.1 EAL domain-containing protein [Actimicrobium sp. CCC2.4]